MVSRPGGPLGVASLGDFLREQRRSAQLSIRQLAEQAGVSNPYLSQIERGLRKPSAEILQQIAKGLRISAEQVYVHAGILEERPPGDLAVESALLADSSITERQKRVLRELYQSFRAENAAAAAADAPAPAAPTSAVPGSAVPGSVAPNAAVPNAAVPNAAVPTAAAPGREPDEG